MNLIEPHTSISITKNFEQEFNTYMYSWDSESICEFVYLSGISCGVVLINTGVSEELR